MFRAEMLIIGILFLSCGVVAKECKQQVTIKSQVFVTEKYVFVKDFLQVESLVGFEKTELDKILMKSPSVSNSILLPKSQIEGRFPNLASYCFVFPEEVLIQRSSRTIDSNGVKDAIISYIERVTSDSYAGGVNVRFSTDIEDVLIPDGGEVRVVVSKMMPELPSERATVWVDIIRNSETVRSINVRIQISYMQYVWKVRQRMEVGQRFNEVLMEKVLVNNANGEYLSSASSLANYAAKRPLVSGDLIKAIDVKTPDLVSPGQLLTANFRSGSVALQVKVVATEYANLGETFFAKRENGQAISVYMDNEGRIWVL